jgi:tetratricopeptide (TPR) repeat protein
LLAGGCAARKPAEPAGTSASAWQCDARADDAVEQGNWERSRQMHESLLQENPANCLAIYHLGYIYGKLGDRPQEAHCYNQAIACGYDQDVQLYFNLGMAYADMGLSRQALATFQRAAQLDPHDADIHFGAGLMAVELDQPGLAENELNRAVSLDARHWQARLALANLLLDQSRWDEAMNQLKRVRSGDPHNEQAQELQRILEERRASEYK